MLHQIFTFTTLNSFYPKENETMILVICIIALVLIVYLFGNTKGRNLPPGPRGLPVFGYYPFLGKNPEIILNEVAKKYGNVFGLYLGPKYIVFLNDWNSVKDALGQDALSDRPPALFGDGFGITEANGAEWVQTRRLVMRIIKSVGFSNARWEEIVKEDAKKLALRISQEGDKPVEVKPFFSEFFTNSILTLILGKKFCSTANVTAAAADLVDSIIENVATLSILNFSPKLHKILQFLRFEKEFQLDETVKRFGELISNTADDLLQNLTSETEASFVASFQEEILNNRKKDEKICLSEEHLKGNIATLFAGGNETGRNSIIWALIAMADHQEIQRKVHEELDDFLGNETSIQWSDRTKIPYTYATLLETMRWRTVVPFTTIRMAREDVLVQGYRIPKGTYMTTNNWSLHNDPKYWNNPDQFLPERFLLEDGKKVNSTPDSFNPFSYGRRNCPGKLLALVETFQYFCTLMKKFKVMPKEGNKVKYDTIFGLTYEATNVELRFILR